MWPAASRYAFNNANSMHICIVIDPTMGWMDNDGDDCGNYTDVESLGASA